MVWIEEFLAMIRFSFGVRGVAGVVLVGLFRLISASAAAQTPPVAAAQTPFSAAALVAAPVAAPAIATAVLKPGAFVNPLKESGPDPWVYAWQGQYVYTNTTGHTIELWRTAHLGELRQAEHKVVWTPEADKPWSKELWAPEITRWNGKWYIYFCADALHNETHRLYVLENASADPLAGEWTLKGQVSDATNRWAIDPDVFEVDGVHFLLWSGWEGDKDGEQRVYIARMKNPWTVDSERTELSRPTAAWEKHGELPNRHLDVNEGPEGLVHGNRVFVYFSASACWQDEYALGLLWADRKANLLDPKSWHKLPEPVLKQDPEKGVFATGHNGVFRSPDGQDWIIYHANERAGMGCSQRRSPRIQPLAWDKDGMPQIGRPAALGEAMQEPK